MSLLRAEKVAGDDQSPDWENTTPSLPSGHPTESNGSSGLCARRAPYTRMQAGGGQSPGLPRQDFVWTYKTKVYAR
jgi:hypothetical protein